MKKNIDFNFVLKKIRNESKNKAELGTRFENLTKDFLKVDKFYKNRFVKVWKWMEWPDRETRDIGIDLIAEERDGSLCAIQCKCYADDGSIDMKHVSTFLALADGLKIKKKILVYTGETLTKNADIILRKHRCQIIGQEHLRSSSIDWNDFPKLDTKKPKTLFDYQNDAKSDVVKNFEKHDRGKLIMACGTGKTLVSLHIAEQIAGKGKLVLFLVPSISLILQSMREWSDNANMKHYYVAVCSDKSTGEEGSIAELESPVSTDVNTLRPYIENRPKDSMTVIFSTYHSIEVVQKAMKDESFDVIFCDEAHRTTGAENQSFYTFVHDDKNIKSKKRLYMTATPRIYNYKIKAKMRDVIYSMDNEKQYGPNFHKLSFTEAVHKHNALTDFKVKIAIVPVDVVDKDFQLSVAGDDMSMPLDERTLLAAVWHGLLYPEDNHDSDMDNFSYYTSKNQGKPQLLQRVIAFSNRIDRSQMFAGDITDSNDNSRSFEKIVREFESKMPTGSKVEVEHVDGKNNAIYRRDKMRWLQESDKDLSTCRILSNARCLSEGVDVPALDGVVFLNPRKSVVDVVQSVGRVMRKSQDKKFGYVILPVAVPAGITPNEALDNNDTYQVVWQVLNALRSHDETLANEINSLILDKNTENTKGTGRISVSVLGDDFGKDVELKTEFFDKVKSKLIEKVGDFDYYEKYGAKLGEASATVELRIKNMLETSDFLNQELDKFHVNLKKLINDALTREEVIRVISQHVILSKVFDELFSGEFTSHNPISQVIGEISGKFGLNEELEELEDFYEDVHKEMSRIKTSVARQNFIKTIYGNFFNSTAKKETEQHGVVYTPVEVIDFIIHSTEHLLHENFNIGFEDRSVKVLDPFTGTGTFITRLLQSGLIKKNLYEKYKHDLFANELILLAYYIATVNIETTYSSLRKSGRYVPFEGISLTDTLQLSSKYKEDERYRMKTEFFGTKFKPVQERIKKQNFSHLHVILGNPPYSSGQSVYSDNNPNINYPEIDEQIQNTYARTANTKLKNSLYDSYVRSLRWASDRIGKQGIISFITNASFLDSNTASGIRASFEKEFNEIWCYNLRGNQRTQGEISRKEGGKIFGSGSRAPIAIIFLVKNPKKKGKTRIYYKDIGDYHTREAKLEIIKNEADIKGVKNWTILTPDKNFDWINQRNAEFEKYLIMGNQETKAGIGNSIFKIQGPGVGTSRDAWVYNFSKEKIMKNMKCTIDYCNKQNVNDPKLGKKEHDQKQVSWSHDLANRLKRTSPVLDKRKIRNSLYRPFFKQYLYYDNIFNERPGIMKTIFPDDDLKNVLIAIPHHGNKEFSTIITDVIPNGDCLQHTQCFPLYTYDIEFGKKVRKENITNFTLTEYQEFYNDKKIRKEDIFYYIYGILHHPEYKKKYKSNLLRDTAHIPMAPKFWKYVESGKSLANLHLKYENCGKYKLGKPKIGKFGKLEKISFGRKIIDGKNNSDYSEIWINGTLVFDNIPKIDYTVNGRTPLEWIIDRYKVRIDKASGIVNEPGDVDIISIIERAVYVGIESDKIIKNLPEEFEPKEWDPKKKGLDEFT